MTAPSPAIAVVVAGGPSRAAGNGPGSKEGIQRMTRADRKSWISEGNPQNREDTA